MVLDWPLGKFKQLFLMNWYVHMPAQLTCSRMMKAWIGFQHFMPVLDFLPFTRIKHSPTVASLPASLSPLQRWEVLAMGVFEPCGNTISISQCNYQDKTFSLSGEGQSFLPWCVEIWFDWKGCAAWCVLVGSRASAAHALSLHVHTIVVEYMAIFSSSELYLHRIVRGSGVKTFTRLRQMWAKKCPIKLSEYGIFKI